MSYPDIEQLRDMPQVFGGVAGYDTHEFNFTGSGDPREIEGAYASSELFPVLGTTPELGRTFGAADEQAPYVMISHRLWASVFGRDPTVLGRSIQLDGTPFTVIGVMPATFRFPSENIDLWAPLGGAFAASPEARTDRNLHLFNTVGTAAAGSHEGAGSGRSRNPGPAAPGTGRDGQSVSASTARDADHRTGRSTGRWCRAATRSHAWREQETARASRSPSMRCR